MRRRRKQDPTVRPSRRAVRVTRRRRARPTPEVWRRAALIVGVGLLTVVVALVWGTILKRRSDRYRASQLAGDWEADTSAPLPQAEAVELRGGRIAPDGTLPETPAESTCVCIRLSENANGRLDYALSGVADVGPEVEPGAPTLTAEVERLHRQGMRVIGLFEVQCLNEAYRSDPAVAVLRRGIEQSLLLSAAGAGVDELLLLGCPSGGELESGTLSFLQETRQLLAETDPDLLFGVVLPVDAFVRVEDETVPALYGDETDPDGVLQYTGWRTPGRFLSVCDRLVVDLRAVPIEEADTQLRGFRHSYAHWGLTLLIDDATISELADLRGMRRQLYVEGD